MPGQKRKASTRRGQTFPHFDTTNRSNLSLEAVNEQRRVLEQEQYNMVGSVVEDSDSDDEAYVYGDTPVRLDRASIIVAAKKALTGDTSFRPEESPAKRKKPKTPARAKDSREDGGSDDKSATAGFLDLEEEMVDADRDGGSIFGQTQAQSNAIWVECDKCKKWRRLRGVVDEKKLPSKWYCSMNRSDPERSRCSAPEEEYETPHTPESAADARSRKHLRVWVRRLQVNEQYEHRLPTLTRNKKRHVTASSKDAFEWVRCCHPSCGKWRAVLKFMDAKKDIIERTTNGEWYCVMNTWDEKMASCAAPQENLPALGCPPWVMQDGD